MAFVKKPTRLSRTARRRRKSLIQSPVEDATLSSRKSLRRRKHRKRTQQKSNTNIRDKVRPDGRNYSEYSFEVHLTPEDIPVPQSYPRSNKFRNLASSKWVSRQRKPGSPRKYLTRVVVSHIQRGEHEDIVEHLQSIMPVRAIRKRRQYKQKTRIYVKRENDLVLFKALYDEKILKVYRLVDKEQ